MEPEKQVVAGLEAGWYARSTSRKVGEVVTAHVYVEEEDDAVRCDHGERICPCTRASTQSLLTCLDPATAPRRDPLHDVSRDLQIQAIPNTRLPHL